MPNPFSIAKSTNADVSIIELEGYLDAHTAPQFENTIAEEIENGKLKIVVDGTKLTYISSAGLGVFMSFVEEVREQDGDIKICGLTPKVETVFEVLGFSEIFDMCATQAEAVARFNQPSIHTQAAGSGAEEM